MNRSVHAFRIFARLLLAAFASALMLAANAADRVALLIGNNNYSSMPLRNAVNDAKDLGDALKELGFKVIVKDNATRKDMIDGIREFGTALEGADVALFFYAGHAMQFKDSNYLIPVDVAMGSEEDVTFFGLHVQQVFDRMERARTRHNFIILDACRDNPFASSFKVSSTGLAQMNAPSGTLIAYATSPGSVAADGYQRNGIYTKHVLQNIKVPDVPVEIMFKRVREGVERETLKRQTPWDSSSLKGDFAFNTSSARSAGASGPSGGSSDVALSIELAFWNSAKESNRADDIQAYLDKYPSGAFSTLARNRLEALKPTRIASVPEVASATRAAPPPTPQPAPAAAAEKTPLPTPEPVAAKPEKPQPKPAEESKPVVVAAAPSRAPPPATSIPTTAVPAVARTDTLPGREVAPGIREVTFADGAIYRGGVRGSALHGKGEYLGKSFKYEGEFKDGLKIGQGTLVWDNGNRYEGPFADDVPNGIGKYTFANGDLYSGEVKAGTISGRGTYVKKSGDTLEGTFVDGNLDGMGIHRFASGDRYEGQLVKGKPQGKGLYITRDGDRIDAPFVNGEPNGKGLYLFANGDRYEGDITRSELTGQGAYLYKSGLKYEGEMRRGQPQGKGTFWFLDGSRFEGTFENGLARARGQIVRQDNTSAPAEIVDGQVRLLN